MAEPAAAACWVRPGAGLRPPGTSPPSRGRRAGPAWSTPAWTRRTRAAHRVDREKVTDVSPTKRVQKVAGQILP